MIASAVEHREKIRTIVSISGRIDLASDILSRYKTPILFIVGEHDYSILKLTNTAMKKIKSEKKLEIISNVAAIFDKNEAIEKVINLTKEWFLEHL